MHPCAASHSSWLAIRPCCGFLDLEDKASAACLCELVLPVLSICLGFLDNRCLIPSCQGQKVKTCDGSCDHIKNVKLPGKPRSCQAARPWGSVGWTSARLYGSPKSGVHVGEGQAEVDGQNPAPVGRWFIPLFIIIGLHPSQPLQDFVHPQ